MSNTAPIRNPNLPYRVHAYADIFTGANGSGQIVPNVNDRVDKIVGNTLTSYVVTAVSAGTYLSTLVELTNPDDVNDLSDTDILFGVVPTNPKGITLLYIDRSTLPYTATIEQRNPVFGTDIVTAKVFQGTDISTIGRVISATYDSSGTYTGENVSLSLLASSALNNNMGIKVLNSFSTSADLVDGELVTAVYYNIDGQVVRKDQHLVYNTAFVRPTNISNREVVGISLNSPFLSQTNTNVINYPLNLQANVNNFSGVVHYGDGTSSPMAIDGTRFAVSGLDAYRPTGVGQSFPVQLKYNLQAGEVAYGLTNSASRQFAKNYTLNTVSANLSYQVRLFAYPVWVSNIVGYQLRWWLCDMNRSQITDVTSYVTLVNNTSFNGLQYGTKQVLTASLNLMAVNPTYQSFVYSQDVDVMLQSAGTFRQNSSTPPNWYVAPVSGLTPMYGAGVYATAYSPVSNVTKINLAGVYTTQSNWLAAMLSNTQPLINSPTETAYPTPTHFAVYYGGTYTVYPISSWNQDLTINNTFTSNDTLYVMFYDRTTNVDLQIGVSGVPIYAISSNGAYL